MDEEACRHQVAAQVRVHDQPGQRERTVTVPAGSSWTTVSVSIKHDTVAESNESFLLQLTSTSEGQLSKFGAWGTILDDDPPRINALNAGYAGEADGWMWFMVALSGPVTSQVTVSYATLETIGQWPATPWADFVPVSGTLTFGPGQMGQWIPVQIINDSVFGEPDEEIHLALWGASGLALADDFAVGRIIDDDQIR